MNILIISNSLVVTELFKMTLQKYDIDAEYVKSAKDAKDESYSAIFIDDSLYNFEEEIDYIKDNFDFNELIVIGKDSNKNASYILKKPFLSEDIEEILDEIKENSNSEDEEFGNILDLDEIEKIKSLMELAESEEKGKFLSKLEKKESIKAKNKKAKKLLRELCTMDKKEIKKLFKEAKVLIKIEFKDSNE